MPDLYVIGISISAVPGMRIMDVIWPTSFLPLPFYLVALAIGFGFVVLGSPR